MKKKLTLIATAVALGALVVVGATMAYFTSQDTATNVITTGNVQITINETSEDEENTIMTENGIQYVGVFTPGQEISKIPVVNNDGSNDAFVRAYVEFKYYDAEHNDITANFTGKEPIIVYNTKENNEGYWIKGTEVEGPEYYYFSKAIEAKNGVTTELFDTVTIPTSWDNAQANVTIEVIVHADGIQSDNNKAETVELSFANFTK